MTLRVKYCGGCNPRYDRKALVQRLYADCPGLTPASPADGETPDLAVVVCGCPARCATHDTIVGRHGKWIVSSFDEYNALRGAVVATYSKGE